MQASATKQLVITLEDWAPAFDPREQEEPDHIDKPSDERPIGGLGVFLALQECGPARL